MRSAQRFEREPGQCAVCWGRQVRSHSSFSVPPVILHPITGIYEAGPDVRADFTRCSEGKRPSFLAYGPVNELSVLVNVRIYGVNGLKFNCFALCYSFTKADPFQSDQNDDEVDDEEEDDSRLEDEQDDETQQGNEDTHGEEEDDEEGLEDLPADSPASSFEPVKLEVKLENNTLLRA